MSSTPEIALEVARSLLDLILKLVSRDVARQLLDEAAVRRAERFGQLLDEEKFGTLDEPGDLPEPGR